MPRFLTPFVAIVAMAWTGGILVSMTLLGLAAPTSTALPPASFSVIVPITTPSLDTAAPSLSTLVPQVSAGSVPSLVAPSGSAATATPSPRASSATSASLLPQPSASPVPSVSSDAPSLPPVTQAPTQSPVIVPTPSPTPAVTPTPIVTPPPTLPPTLPPTPAPTPVAMDLSCGNEVDNSGGLGLICDTTVIVGVSATTTECHGAAGNPRAACSTRTVFGSVTSVSQCNGSENGGGSVLRCSVTVLGGSGPPATINQCVGSGDGITTGCDPFPATAPNATIIQCNGTANGGTLVELTCTATGSQAVAVDQCNGSGNGGGSLVVCSAELE